MRSWIFFFLLLLLPVVVSAADDIAAPIFSLTPSKIEASLKPGEKVTKHVSVVNTLGYDATFSISVEDIGPSKNSQESAQLYGDQNGPYSIRQLVRVPYVSVRLNNGERQNIPIEITAPPNADLSGRYGVVMFSVSNGDQVDPGAAKIVSRLGAILLVKIDGQAKESGGVESFGVIGPSLRFYSDQPLLAQVTFKNDGNVHLNTYGIVVAKNIFGQEVALRELDPWFVLPGGTRLREISFGNELSFGRYKLEAKINRGYNDQIDERSVVVWIFPRPWLSALIMILLLGGVTWLVSKYRHKHYV